MIFFEFFRHIIKIRLRLLIVFILLFLVALFSTDLTKSYLNQSGFISSELSTILTIHDFIIGTFNMPTFVMLFAFPILFSILIVDLIISDLSSGYIQVIFARLDKRSDYIIAKCITIFLFSILFTIMVIFTLLVVGFLFQFKFTNPNQHFLFSMMESVSFIYFQTILFFILGLNSIGILTLFLSLCFKSSGIAMGLIIAISFLNNAFYVLGANILLALSPFSQYIVGLHYEIQPHATNLPYFTLMFSQFYMLFLIGLIPFLLLKMILIEGGE